ncbi:MAG: M14 family metallopeptidase [Candidatus Aminicenantes bacterium]|nr:M14 family metallopeptidase [Candidatus Aminicenantes bacterium]
MNHRAPKIALALPCAALMAMLFLSSLLPAQTSPEAFLGFKVGADRKLADYNQIQAYFQKLEKETAKLKLLTIGESTLKKPMIMAVITSEANMAKLDEYRAIAKKIKDPRGLPIEEAKKLAKEGKLILLITCSLHAEEIAASQMSMELAYKLVKGETPWDAGKVLDDVIVLLIPTINPDGEQMEVDWYKKYLGTKYEGGSMPWLYHFYAGHDDNRDWFMFNLAETRAVTKVLYHDWFPQIHIDEHQMGHDEARLFIPPFMNPPVPNVQPLLWREVNLAGANMAFDLQRNGFQGVVHGRSFTGWWIGACDDTSWMHNVVGILSEMASVKLATPVYVEPTEIPKSYTQRRVEFPDPWPGGWWRLRDIVDYELTLSLSLINTGARFKEEFLLNSYLMGKSVVEATDKGQPYAFVIPAKQNDYPTMVKMLEVLEFGGSEIQRAKEDFVAEGKVYGAGSYVVLLAQPYKPFVWALLERQKYPDLREYPGGPPVPPYDNAGWTLPLQMGVACDQVDHPFAAKLERVEKIGYAGVGGVKGVQMVGVRLDAAVFGEPKYLVLDARENASYAVAFALLKEKAEITRSKGKIAGKGFEAPAGSFIVKNTPEVQKAMAGLLEKRHATAWALDDAAGIAAAALKNPRIGLYQSWWSSMDEGWSRYVLDDLGIPYATLHNLDFRGPKAAPDAKPAKPAPKVDLKAKYDVIVFAGENPDIIATGKVDPASPYARWFTPLPPEYEGGLEKEGVAALKAFVEAGGTLITLNEACKMALKEFEAPVKNAIEKIEPTKFFCPMSILRLAVDNTTPIGYGLQEETAAVFSESLALETWLPGTGDWERKVVASYPENNVLMSGWLLGEDYIARKAAVVDLKYKKGRIILVGIVSQNRAQSHGTYKFLLNGLLYPEGN